MNSQFHYKYILLFFTLFHAWQASGQYVNNKTHKAIFPMTNIGELNITNKYGDININAWSTDSVKVVVYIETRGKNADELLEQLKPNFIYSEEYLFVETSLKENSSSYFSKIFKNVKPIILDKSKVQINYDIWLPINTDIDIDNTYGNLIINDSEGKLKANIVHGDIRLNSSISNVNIDIKFGHLRAHQINKGSIKIKNGDVSIREVKNLSLTSSGSTIDLNDIESLILVSNRDLLDINNIQSLNGEIRFSKINIESLESVLDVDIHLGELTIESIVEKAPRIIIDQTASDIMINATNSSFKINAELEGGLFRLPKDVKDLDVNVIESKKEKRKIFAILGNKPYGTFKLIGKKGFVQIKN